MPWSAHRLNSDFDSAYKSSTSSGQTQSEYGKGLHVYLYLWTQNVQFSSRYQPGHGSGSYRAGILHWSGYLALGHSLLVRCVIVVVNVLWHFHASLGLFYTILPFTSQVAMETSLSSYKTLISLGQYFKIVSGVKIYPWISKLFIENGVKSSIIVGRLWHKDFVCFWCFVLFKNCSKSGHYIVINRIRLWKIVWSKFVFYTSYCRCLRM